MTDLEKTYSAHRNEWENAANKITEWDSTIQFLRDTENSDFWFHYQLYCKLDPILEYFPNRDWLTVGDGRFGRDAHYLAKGGAKVMASDIGIALLRAAQERGFISEFSEENAERLSFTDEKFDFVLCKDALHHFPRPFLALYEMLRVSKVGIVLIEPNDTRQTLSPVLLILNRLRDFAKRAPAHSMPSQLGYTNEWEEVGNYVYTFSPRDFERMALSLGLAGLAFCGVNVVPISAKLAQGKDEKVKIRNLIRRKKIKDLLVRLGLLNPGMFTSILFKVQPSESVISGLRVRGFTYIKFTYPLVANNIPNS